MAVGAHVTSIEALESFRANLIVYISKARPTLEEISSDVMRTRLWLENNQRLHWEAQVQRRAKELEAARQELFSAGLANLRDTTAAEIMAVRRAERALEDADNKLRLVKKWTREFDSRTAPVARQLEKLATMLANDLPSAVAFLSQIIKTLDAYGAGGSTPVLSEATATVKTDPAAAKLDETVPSQPSNLP